MTWRRYLQSRTRNPAFLWRMVIGILLAGVVVGGIVDWAVGGGLNAEKILAADDDVPAPEPTPTPDPSAPDGKQLKQIADSGDWMALWRAIPGAVMRSWRHWGATALAVLTGVCWAAFALQSVQPRSLRDGRLWLTAAAPWLGVLSVWPTFFLIYWQERQWGLAESELVAPGIKFFVLGVGLREELSKFVCFLPLLPWCVWRRDELAALVMAGAVGIGFAMQENVDYIWYSIGMGTMGRLLSAAPFHMALTGILGLAAYRACVWPKELGPIFVATFGVVMFAHGLYDAFLALPQLNQLPLVSTLIFVAVIYQFFRELRPKQKLLVEPISLTANFLIGISTVAAATFVYLSASVGVTLAADMLVGAVVGEALMVYLFLREMPETMVTV